MIRAKFPVYACAAGILHNLTLTPNYNLVLDTNWKYVIKILLEHKEVN